jgi:hypothetical protein
LSCCIGGRFAAPPPACGTHGRMGVRRRANRCAYPWPGGSGKRTMG